MQCRVTSGMTALKVALVGGLSEGGSRNASEGV